jgi:Carboxypeptidase regulatory-like domain
MTAKRIFLVALGTCTLYSALLSATHAQEQRAPAPRPSEPSSGTISGKVVSEGGTPVAGASVFIRAVNSPTQGRTTTSDNEGNFRVNNLDASLYTISAVVPAYTTAPRDPDASPVYYRIGDTAKLELIRGGVITGTVTNALGEPVVAVRVRAYMVRDVNGQTARGMYGGERTTDDRGIYRIYGMPSGTYVVVAGGAATSQAFTVNAYDFDAPTYAPSSTRDNAAEIVVRSGEESNADIRYRSEPGRIVSGTVKGIGTYGASISLTSVGTGSLMTIGTFQSPVSSGFALYGVPDGDYDLVAQQNVSMVGATMPDLAVSEPRRISVKRADVTGIELTTKPMGSVSGRISLEASRIPECQGKRKPALVETIVELKRNQKNPESDQASALRLYAGSAAPDKEGVFTLRNLRTGQYAFNPRFFARYWYLQSILLAPSPGVSAPAKPAQTSSRTDAARNWTSVKPGDRITGLTITLAEGAASLQGEVIKSEDSKMPERLRVYLLPSERDKAEDVLRYFAVDVADDGTFAINNLPPGRYWSITQTRLDNELSPERLRLPTAAEERVKLRRAAEAAKNEIELKPCQNLTGYKLPLKTN